MSWRTEARHRFIDRCFELRERCHRDPAFGSEGFGAAVIAAMIVLENEMLATVEEKR